MKSYSVLLLYPDYIASNFGQETYYAFVDALSPMGAVREAQAAARLANRDCEPDEEDFFPLCVTEGHHPDMLI